MSKTDHVGVQESSSCFNLNSELIGRQNRSCRRSCTDVLDLFEKLLQNTFKIKVILLIRCTFTVGFQNVFRSRPSTVNAQKAAHHNGRRVNADKKHTIFSTRVFTGASLKMVHVQNALYF